MFFAILCNLSEILEQFCFTSEQTIISKFFSLPYAYIFFLSHMHFPRRNLYWKNKEKKKTKKKRFLERSRFFRLRSVTRVFSRTSYKNILNFQNFIIICDLVVNTLKCPTLRKGFFNVNKPWVGYGEINIWLLLTNFYWAK